MGKRRYVVHIFYASLRLIADFTANQFKLKPSMDVSDTHTSLRLSIDIGASEANTPLTMKLCFPIIRDMSFTILAESSVVAQRNLRR